MLGIQSATHVAHHLCFFRPHRLTLTLSLSKPPTLLLSLPDSLKCQSLPQGHTRVGQAARPHIRRGYDVLPGAHRARPPARVVRPLCDGNAYSAHLRCPGRRLHHCVVQAPVRPRGDDAGERKWWREHDRLDGPQPRIIIIDSKHHRTHKVVGAQEQRREGTKAAQAPGDDYESGAGNRGVPRFLPSLCCCVQHATTGVCADLMHASLVCNADERRHRVAALLPRGHYVGRHAAAG